MAKKKGKKGKKGKGKPEKVAIVTTPMMAAERARIAATGEPLGHHYAVSRRGSELRAEVAKARLIKAVEKQQAHLDLRGLDLDTVPAALTVATSFDEEGNALPPSNNAMERFATTWQGLTILDLSHNGLFKAQDTFDGLAALGGRLQELSLRANSLATNVPASAAKLTGLRKLDLSDNQLTFFSEEAAEGWAQIKSLSAARNAFVVLPDSAKAWACLEHLDLRGNKLALLGPETTFGAWPVLRVANLGKNQVAKLPPTVGKCPRLTELVVTDNKIASLPVELAQCQQLRVLHAGVNAIKEVPPELFATEGGLGGTLQVLQLYRNKLASLPDEMHLPNLEELSLSGNAFKAMPPAVARCSRLRELHMANNKLSKVPEELRNCKALTYVSFLGCSGVKALPPALANAWPALREVDVRSGAKKEKCKYTADWVDASNERHFVLRGGIPPKKKKGGGKKKK